MPEATRSDIDICFMYRPSSSHQITLHLSLSFEALDRIAGLDLAIWLVCTMF